MQHYLIINDNALLGITGGGELNFELGTDVRPEVSTIL